MVNFYCRIRKVEIHYAEKQKSSFDCCSFLASLFEKYVRTKNYFFFFPLAVFGAGVYLLCKMFADDFNKEIERTQKGEQKDFLYTLVSCGVVIAFFIACFIYCWKWDFRFDVENPDSFLSHLGGALMVFPYGFFVFILPYIALVPINAFLTWVFGTVVEENGLFMHLFFFLASVFTFGHLCGIVDLAKALDLVGTGLEFIRAI